MYKILVVYHYNNAYEFPVRAATWNHINSFKRYSGHRCVYLNLAFGRIPSYIGRIKFDLVIFHTIFLSARWSPSLFEQVLEKAKELKQIRAIKVAMPQDEYIYTDVLCDFINDYEIKYVFSVSPESEWPKIYHKVNAERTKFYQVLTGYLDDGLLKYVNRLSSNVGRSIDIGYRAKNVAPWLGRLGLLKVKIAEIFQQEAPRRGLITDISTQQKDVLLGTDWYKFLLRCRYMVGVSGGSSILDRDGMLKNRTEEYLKLSPEATFEEIEHACFPGMDGSLGIAVISPRHLEACATRTCQILVEGDYNGILAPGKHYIEVKRDFSNLDQVLNLVRDDVLREALTFNAYRDIVESGRYSYRNMVQFVLEKALEGVENKKTLPVTNWIKEEVMHYRSRCEDRFDWLKIAFIWRRMQVWQGIRAYLHSWLPLWCILLLRKVLGVTGEYPQKRR